MAQQYAKKQYRLSSTDPLRGNRFVLKYEKQGYPAQLAEIAQPPPCLYGVGDPAILEKPALGIIGARKASSYGRRIAQTFSRIAAEKGIVIVSGGAVGCDTAAHQGALEVQGPTVVVLGGGCNKIYPAVNRDLFQAIVDKGGAVISEQQWDFPPLPHTFRARNRIIAGLSRAILITEAGLPSGTFSTADDALASNRDVLVVPGAITSPNSRGANQLIYQGAIPVINRSVFQDILFSLYGCLKSEEVMTEITEASPLVAALQSQPQMIDDLLRDPHIEQPKDKDKLSWLITELAHLEKDGLIERFSDGRYGFVKV